MFALHLKAFLTISKNYHKKTQKKKSIPSSKTPIMFLRQSYFRFTSRHETYLEKSIGFAQWPAQAAACCAAKATPKASTLSGGPAPRLRSSLGAAPGELKIKLKGKIEKNHLIQEIDRNCYLLWILD